VVEKQETASRAADLRLALNEAIEEIEAGCRDFIGGRVSAYQSVATQLRKLLTEKNALLQRVLPNVKFARLRPPKDPNASWAVDPRGTLSISSGMPPIHIELETTPGEEVSPQEWMNDWIVTPDCSIRDLIKEMGNKESAHTDDKLGYQGQ
jgi:hypothetical protein